MELYGLPGGDVVDGLPPAASTDTAVASWPGDPLERHFREFSKFLIF